MGARLDILPISFSLLWHNRYVESSRLSLTPCVLAIHFLTSCSPHSDCMSMPVGTWFGIVTSSFLVANPENASQVSPTSDLRTDSWDQGLALQPSLLLTLAACQALSFPLTPQCLLRPWFRNSSLFWPEMCDFFPSTLSFSPHFAYPMRVRSSTPTSSPSLFVVHTSLRSVPGLLPKASQPWSKFITTLSLAVLDDGRQLFLGSFLPCMIHVHFFSKGTYFIFKSRKKT